MQHNASRQISNCQEVHFGCTPFSVLSLCQKLVWMLGMDLYKDVKRTSDSYLGIPSQCFVARKASIGVPQARGRPQYCANIAMKVNAKLDGVNCALASIQPFMKRPFMVIGALNSDNS